MRISDWSSDVCSSDLAANGEHGLAYLSHFSTLCWSLGSPPKTSIRISQTRSPRADRRRLRLHAALQQEPGVEACSNCAGPIAASASKFGRVVLERHSAGHRSPAARADERSEEQTSERQYLLCPVHTVFRV